MLRKPLQLRWRHGNAIELLQNGAGFFTALCDAIDHAQRTVHLETYIFNLDETGARVLDALRRACERGVRVRLVIDGFGSAQHAASIQAQLQDMGAQCRIYRPQPVGLRGQRFNLRRLRRLHRKTTVVDDHVGFVGGINILDDLFDVPNDGIEPMPRFDFAVRLQGPIVADLARAQRALWLRMSWRRRDDWDTFQRRQAHWLGWWQARMKKHATKADAETGVRATLLLRDNLRFRQKIERVYMAAISSATDEILIANAYFFPRRKLRQALIKAARRGVSVRLLLQGRPEYPMQFRASRYMYDELLAAGIKLYEYQASYLHAKVAVIDQCAMVGSANLDPFSSLLAREANVWVQNADFAASLKASLDAAVRQHCHTVTLGGLRRRGLMQRALDSVSYLALRIGVAITGKSSEY